MVFHTDTDPGRRPEAGMDVDILNWSTAKGLYLEI